MALTSKPRRESEFAKLFAARRDYDAARSEMNKALAHWIMGAAPDAAVKESLDAADEKFQALRVAVDEHRNTPKESTVTDAFGTLKARMRASKPYMRAHSGGEEDGN